MNKLFNIVREAFSSETQDFTKINLKKAIVLLAIPMILEMVMESLFAVVDVFFVEKISVNAVATIGLTESVAMLIYSIAIGVSMAATALVSRRIGEKDPEAASRAAEQTILLGIVLGVVLGIFGFIYAGDILRLMGGSEELIAEGVGFTRIFMASNIVIILLFLLNGIFRGAGNPQLSMWSLFLANGLNIILDPLLIFGIGPFPELGLEGAAYATMIGRGAGVAFQLYILMSNIGIIRISKKIWSWNQKLVIKIIDISSGATAQYLIASASWIFLMRIISDFGSEAVAGYTIAIRIIIFTILPCWGLSNAAATLVGQNLGAKQPDRAELAGWKVSRYNMYFLLIVSILYFTFAPELMSIFTDEPAVLAEGILCLRIMSVGYVFFSYGMVLSQAFNGAGDTRTPTMMNLICFWAVEIPLAYFLAIMLNWGPKGVYIAICVSETLLALLCIILWKRGKWKLKKV